MSSTTEYRGIVFRSRLDAQWAAFFDLASWHWEYRPLNLPDWSPTFLIRFPCRHSECDGSHTLLVEVRPFSTIDEFQGLPCLDYPFGCHVSDDHRIISADASAAFGINPGVVYWEMSHGSGGGAEENIQDWIEINWLSLWQQADASLK